ncbi:heterokaryon incompatibility protein-domain-containing protein [Cladorrhinum sp. PSN259]|nr:heterokaryon incompatibility protein-domain-containing protein [Cladorrhinum sp. PSN259]
MLNTECNCSSANRPVHSAADQQSTSKSSQAWTTADLCAQCASIDLNGLLQLGWQSKPHQLLSLSSGRKSSCPLCRFFAAIGSSNKPEVAADAVLKVLLGQRGYRGYLSRLLLNEAKEWASEFIYKAPWIGLSTEGSDASTTEFGIMPVISRSPGDQLPTFAVRQLDAGFIDFAVLRGWVSYCKFHHQGNCGILQSHPQQVPGLKLIDCETGAIVDASSGCEFAALSYVWGATHGSDKDEPVRKGYLPNDVPQTISDAVQAVRQLGLRYLWIDKYCIDQDDIANVKQQISVMDIIYNLAVVTIIAACGEDASFGLPGVGRTSRVQQPTINLNGQIWVSCLDFQQEMIRRSKWNSRGWTYQEALFSRRRLFFTEEQVYFECNSICCPEMAAYDFHYLTEKIKYLPQGLFQGGFSFPIGGGLEDRIRDYTTRDLTFQGDAINALRGVFRAFAAMPSPVRQFWGIPMDYYKGVFSPWPPNTARIASWEFPGSVDAAFARALCWHLNKPASRREGFPSWSWAGWMGHLSHSHPWGFSTAFGDSEVKVWLQRSDGTYDRLCESVITCVSQQDGQLSMAYTPTLRVEAWTSEVRFEYIDQGFDDVRTQSENDNPDPRYFTSIMTRDPEPQGTLYWPLVLSAQVAVGDEFHRMLCQEKFDCIWFSKQAYFGVVVWRAKGIVAERIGHIDAEWYHFEPEGGEEVQDRKHVGRPVLFEYCLPKRRIILMR